MGEKRMENFALEQVRPEDRKGWISLAFVQMGMIICVPSLSGNAAVEGDRIRNRRVSLNRAVVFPSWNAGGGSGNPQCPDRGIYLWKKGSQISDRNSDAGKRGVWHERPSPAGRLFSAASGGDHDRRNGHGICKIRNRRPLCALGRYHDLCIGSGTEF